MGALWERASIAICTNHGMHRSSINFMRKIGYTLEQIKLRSRHKSNEALLVYIRYPLLIVWPQQQQH